MKKRRSLFQKAVSIFTGFLLIFQSLTPNFFISSNVFAENSTPSEITTTEAPSPNPTEIIEPTQTPQPTVDETFAEIEVPEVIPTIVQTETKTSTPEPTATPTTEPTSVPEPTATPTAIQEPTPNPLPWTFENVQKDTPYVHNGVILTFTELPEPSGNIKIEEITLTEEQIEATGALSDKAYDITSDMENGKFTYTLSLPIPESAKDKEVEIKFAENETKFNEAETVENTTKTSDESVLTGQLDHFTIFFVTSGIDSTLLSIPVSLNATDKTELKNSDDNLYEPIAYWPLSWDADFQKNQYIEFTFSPDIPDGALITGASILFEYQRDGFKSGSSRDAQLRAWNGTDFNTIIANYTDLQLSAPDVDELKTISIPLDLVNTSQKANAFKFRFYMRGRGPWYSLLLKTRHDYVGLNITYTLPAPINGKPHNKSIPTNDFYFEWDAVDDTRPVTYEFQSSHSNSVDSNGSLIGAWNSILHGNAEQNHLTLPKIHSTGASDGTYYWQVRAINSDGSPSPWSEVWNMTIDRIAPIITIGPYDGTTLTNQNIIVTASTNEGTLNETSHTFTTNGSFDFVATDAAGNTTTETVTITNIDKDAPSIPSGIYFRDTDNNKNIACGGKTNTKHLNVYWNANAESDFDHYEYISFNASGSTGPIRNFFTNYFNASWWTIPLEGTYGVQIRAVDHVGNKSDWFGGVQGVGNSCTYIVDWTAPVITIDDSYNKNWTNQDIMVNASTNEGSLNETSHIFTENGSFTFIATDEGGNTTTKTVTITNIDKTNPDKPTITTPTAEQYFKIQPIVNRWTAVSDASGIKQYAVEYIYDNGHTFPGGPNRYTTATSRNHTPNINEQGGVTIKVRAEDNAGNIGEWSNPIHYTYDATAPIITINPYTTTPTNQNITVTASTNEGSLNETSHIFTENGSFTFIATDLAGNTSSKTVTITNIDKTKPTMPTELQFKNPNLSCGAITNSKTVTIDWEDSTDNVGVAGYDYSINYPLPSGGRGTWNTFFTQSQYRGSLNEGVHNIQVRAKDTAGNVSDWTPLCGITYDSIAPTMTEQTPFEGWYNTNQTSIFTYTDANGIVSGGDVSCDITTEGTNQTCSVTPNVCDAAGNCNTTTIISHGANIDKTIPTSIISSPINTGSNSIVYSNNWNGSITGTANDSGSGIQKVLLSIKRSSDGKYYSSEDGWIDGTEETTRVTANGTTTWSFSLLDPAADDYTITSHAVDNANNIESSYVLTIILDKTIPEVTLSINPTTGDGENGWYKTQPEITLTATEEHIDKIEYQWDAQTDGGWIEYTDPFKPASEGAHVLYYRALDLASNYSDTGIKNIAWDKTALEKAPQNVSVSPNPSNGKNVKVTWEAAKDNAGVDHYTITWKKDGVEERGTNVSETTREYIIPDTLTEGVWNVKVTAVDKAGFTADASTNATVDLTAPAAPTLALTGTGVGSVSLAWNAVEGAVDYSVWYGTTAGVYDYAAHVGNVTSYTIQGLGAGTYYVVVAAYDNVVNRSAFSNEVNTGGAIVGAPGATTGPAEGFQPAGSVLGSETVNPEDSGQALGTTTTATPSFSWWFILIGLLLIIIAIYIYYRQRRRNR